MKRAVVRFRERSARCRCGLSQPVARRVLAECLQLQAPALTPDLEVRRAPHADPHPRHAAGSPRTRPAPPCCSPGPTAFELWPGVRRVADVGGRMVVETELPAQRTRAASVRALPPRRTPTAYVTRFEWAGPGLPETTAELTLAYAPGADGELGTHAASCSTATGFDPDGARRPRPSPRWRRASSPTSRAPPSCRSRRRPERCSRSRDGVRRLLVREVPDAVEHLQPVAAVRPPLRSRARSRAGCSRRRAPCTLQHRHAAPLRQQPAVAPAARPRAASGTPSGSTPARSAPLRGSSSPRGSALGLGVGEARPAPAAHQLGRRDRLPAGGSRAAWGVWNRAMYDDMRALRAVASAAPRRTAAGAARTATVSRLTARGCRVAVDQAERAAPVVPDHVRVVGAPSARTRPATSADSV